MGVKEKKNSLIMWMTLAIDLVVYVIVLRAVIHFFPQHSSPAVLHHAGIASFIGIICLVVFSLILPTQMHLRRISFRDIFVRNILVVTLSQGTFGCLWHLLIIDSSNEVSYNFMMMLGMAISLLTLRVFERSFLGFLRSSGHNVRFVVFVGSDPANKAVYDELVSDPTTGYKVRGYYSDDTIVDAPDTFERLGSRDDFREILCSDEQMGVDELYCSLSHSDDDEIREIIRYCDKHMIRFIYVPRVFQSLQLSLKPEIIGNYVVFTNHHEPLQELNNKFYKRAFDVVMSCIVLLCLIPVVPIIWAIVKIQSPGPLFFKQKRTGMNGEDFVCYKFRSMHVNSDADRVQATKNDPRKFSFGSFMRRYNIDELPQFYNVLRGDMSIVGPRPHMLLHTEQYSAVIEKYMVRHFAKPGITGLAQVSGFRGETTDMSQMEGRIRKDIYYIENWTFALDIKICFMTLQTMFVHDENAY